MPLTMPPASVSRPCRSSPTGFGRYCMRSLARHPELRADFGEPRRMTDACTSPSFEARESAHLRMTTVRVRGKSPPPDRAFDLAVRLVGRQKNVVVVIEPERREIDRDEVHVGTRHADFRNLRDAGKRRLAHPVQALLHAGAIGHAEHFQ